MQAWKMGTGDDDDDANDTTIIMRIFFTLHMSSNEGHFALLHLRRVIIPVGSYIISFIISHFSFYLLIYIFKDRI